MWKYAQQIHCNCLCKKFFSLSTEVPCTISLIRNSAEISYENHFFSYSFYCFLGPHQNHWLSLIFSTVHAIKQYLSASYCEKPRSLSLFNVTDLFENCLVFSFSSSFLSLLVCNNYHKGKCRILIFKFFILIILHAFNIITCIT